MHHEAVPVYGGDGQREQQAVAEQHVAWGGFRLRWLREESYYRISKVTDSVNRRPQLSSILPGQGLD